MIVWFSPKGKVIILPGIFPRGYCFSPKCTYYEGIPSWRPHSCSERTRIISSEFALAATGNPKCLTISTSRTTKKASCFHSRWYNNQIGEVTEWFMVPLSKSGLRLYRSVGSNPTLSAERCWSGLTGTPGERVSGFPRPWVRIPPSPPTTSNRRCSGTLPVPNSVDHTKSC